MLMSSGCRPQQGRVPRQGAESDPSTMATTVTFYFIASGNFCMFVLLLLRCA